MEVAFSVILTAALSLPSASATPATEKVSA
jgi:hypothetical protein